SPGIFRKDGRNPVSRPPDDDALLKSASLFQGKLYLCTHLAAFIHNRRSYLLNRERRMAETFTITTAPADAGFEAFGEDRDGGLWVGSDTEITRVQFDAGYSEFDHELGLPKGFVTDVVRYRGRIYTATQHGVFVLSAAEDASDSSHFIRL